MRELQKRTIDGDEYEFSQMGAKEALRTLTRLSKILGKPLAIGLSAFKPGQSFLDVDLGDELIPRAVEALVSGLDENEVLDLVESLSSKGCLCNGQKIVFNTHYENRLGHLFKVLGAALEVQYGNFFGVLSELRVNSAPKAPGTTPDPQA